MPETNLFSDISQSRNSDDIQIKVTPNSSPITGEKRKANKSFESTRPPRKQRTRLNDSFDVETSHNDADTQSSGDIRGLEDAPVVESQRFADILKANTAPNLQESNNFDVQTNPPPSNSVLQPTAAHQISSPDNEADFDLVHLKCGLEAWKNNIRLRYNKRTKIFDPFTRNPGGQTGVKLGSLHKGRLSIDAQYAVSLAFETKALQGDTVVVERKPKPEQQPKYQARDVKLTLTFLSSNEADRFVSLLMICNGAIMMSEDDQQRMSYYRRS